ncbi:MAG: ATP-binding protein [Candidatus Cloacimonadota bacterium]|nr:ATP-binding protein [Candidatus Cloacimonadota bacterium]
MLLEFQVENYLSFKKNAKLSMIASSSISKKELPDSLISIDNITVLTSAAIFGANASGKSNFLNAIGFMKNFIFESAKESTFGKENDVKNFKLSEDTATKPSTFEMTFMVKNISNYTPKEHIIFRYGFQLDRYRIKSEWLFARFTSLESKLFTRVEDDIQIGEKFREGKQVYKTVGSINKTTLFLSLIANIKGENAPITGMLMSWFRDLRDVTAIANSNFFGITADLMNDKKVKNEILKSLTTADMCIEDIIINKKKLDFNQLPMEIKQEINEKNLEEWFSLSLKTFHSKYNSKKQPIEKVSFDFEKEESDGTKKFFAIIGPILSALNMGLVLVIDEIDARLHPNLCLMLISLFNSKRINRKNAQLIFASHNTLILNKNILRRDQIYLIAKDKYGVSDLYSLLDYKKVRNDASYNKDYLMGKYGAVPYIGNFESLFSE